MTKFFNYLSEEEFIEKNTNWQIIDYVNNLKEVFDKPVDIKILMKNKENFLTSFIVNEIKYYFNAYINDEFAIIMFYPQDGKHDIFKERKNSKTYLGKLFASVIQSVRLMINGYNLTGIGFTAENKKLEKIYGLLDKTIQKRFPDWKLKEINRSNGKLSYTYEKGI